MLTVEFELRKFDMLLGHIGRKEDINLTQHEPDTCRVNELQVEYYLNSSEHLAQKA